MYKYFIIVFTFIFSTYLQAQISDRYIEVVGTHELKIEADQIILILNVKTIDETLEESKVKNDQTVDELLIVLKEFDNTQDNTKLAPLSFGVNYKRDNRERVKDGYYTLQQITFKLCDINKYYKLTNKLIKINNLSINSSHYNNSRYEELNQKAYENAVSAANNKADYLTKKAKVKLGRVLEIFDDSNAKYSLRQSYPNPFNSSTSLTSSSTKMFGSLKIIRKVRIKYQIKE